MLPAVCVCVYIYIYMYIYFSNRMIGEWYILGGAKDFSSLYLTESESDLFESPLKLVIFFLLLDPYIFLIFIGVILASG